MKATSQAKRETYLAQLKNGHLKSRTIYILKYIQDHPECDTDMIRTNLNISHQSATSVISQLLDVGIIGITGERKSGSEVYSTYRFISDAEEQKRLTMLRQDEKYKLWLKQGLTFERNCSSQLYFQLIIENNSIQ